MDSDQTSAGVAIRRLTENVRSLSNSLNSFQIACEGDLKSLAAETRSEQRILDKRLDLIEQRLEAHGVYMKLAGVVSSAIIVSIAAVVVPGWFRVEDGNSQVSSRVHERQDPVSKPRRRWKDGVASWYGVGLHGRPTASGQVFDEDRLTAAHKTLPFGTRVRVTNLENGRSVVVQINDRGPYIKGRIIDLSAGAAERIDLTEKGLAPVQLEVLPAQK